MSHAECDKLELDGHGSKSQSKQKRIAPWQSSTTLPLEVRHNVSEKSVVADSGVLQRQCKTLGRICDGLQERRLPEPSGLKAVAHGG
mmetsp:Transcript_1967/g.4808  ORF Transcript_1967/g.4808 Transcript_1967/m.4808 type:complete len:87 (+) Transcript_1967:373-633(+)